MTDHTTEPQDPSTASRRGFLKAAGAFALLLGACRPHPAQSARTLSGRIGPENPGSPLPARDTPTPFPPDQVPTSFQVFTPHEAETVEAAVARIFPGDRDDPGAREAGVVYYIDHMLAYHEGFNEPTYRRAPFAQTYRGLKPAGRSGVVWVAADQIYRYGYQNVITPREVYRIGVAGLDRLSESRFGQEFKDLREGQQDTLIGDMADGRAGRFDRNLSAESFFHNLRRHTAEGMFSDPQYGGNRDLVGWKLIGHPGAQRAYTPAQFQTEGEGKRRTPQAFAALHAFNPGQPSSDQVVLPVGSGDMQHQH
jgi:gluconate 2-dehydrogenase gamma chain